MSAPDIGRRRSLWPSVALAGAWALVDQASKQWAVNELADRDIDVIGSLRFNLHFNSGMAFSRGTGVGPVIGVLGLVIVCVLVVALRRAESRVQSIAVGLILGGALGNITDRLFRDEGWFRGDVIDFIDLQWWPIFNIADIGVSCGAALMILASVRRPAAATAAGPAASVDGIRPPSDPITADPATADDGQRASAGSVESGGES